MDDLRYIQQNNIPVDEVGTRFHGYFDVFIGASLSEPHTSVYGGTILLCVRTFVRPPYRICVYAPNIRQQFACLAHVCIQVYLH